MVKNSRVSLPLSIALISLSMGTASCARKVEKTEAEATPVRVEAVSASAEKGEIRYTANIKAAEEVPLAFKVGGYVDELLHRPGADGRLRDLQQGDVITKGLVLAKIREADYIERVNQARAALAEATAALEKAEADRNRATALYESKSLTRPDLDAANAQQAMAQARVAAARAQLEGAEIARRDCALVAPIDAVVLARRVEIGTLAAPGTVGFVVANVSTMKAVFGVADAVVERVKLGQTIPLVVESLSGTAVRGRVTAISASADPQSRVFDIEVTIANAGRRLRPGMIATVRVPELGRPGEGAALPLIPLTAVVRSTKSDAGPDDYAVFVAGGSSLDVVVRSRAVKLGGVAGNRISVTEGLRPGERVVVSGTALVADGQKVRIIP